VPVPSESIRMSHREIRRKWRLVCNTVFQLGKC